MDDIAIIKEILNIFQNYEYKEIILFLIFFYRNDIKNYFIKFKALLRIRRKKELKEIKGHIQKISEINIDIYKLLDELIKEIGCERVAIVEYSNGAMNPTDRHKIKYRIFMEAVKDDTVTELMPFIKKNEITKKEILEKINEMICIGDYYEKTNNYKDNDFKKFIDASNIKEWYFVKIGSKEYSNCVYFLNCSHSKDIILNDTLTQNIVKKYAMMLVPLFEELEKETNL